MTLPQPTLKELERLIAFHAKLIYDTCEYASFPNALTADEMQVTVERLRDLIYARNSLITEACNANPGS